MAKSKYHYDAVRTLVDRGFSWDDATSLRRISMTLHAWDEAECGNSNDWSSWSIVRGRKEVVAKGNVVFVHDDNGKPFIERQLHTENKARYEAIPDRENGALKRLERIMARYPDYVAYRQTDCRGCALYIVSKADLGDRDIHSCYNRGIAVCK